MQLTNSEDLLLIFTRNPELGKCKTRLAATIGDKAALAIYNFLLRHTASITEHLTCAKEVYYSDDIWEGDIWDDDVYGKKLQQGSNLGARMANAFEKGFAAGYKRLIIIGSDMLNLKATDLVKAFDLLETNDFVIGPANDGGYYLLGMKTMNKQLFEGKNWGSDTVLKNTIRDLKGKKLALLDRRSDVDVYEDIKDIEAFLPFIKHMKND